ncbi:C69 family dipeptidase [Vagococcus silagei]|uniref:Dipeptidase n=1 Tax=Vagococcus silagei TaxID=2508885 RepID=A0A4V3TV80_9ENTE|nr:C69 family dipeptidase [Vagococcus silagei]THB61859.1 C69 family dipeptidase [Vagococcus silagei]
MKKIWFGCSAALLLLVGGVSADACTSVLVGKNATADGSTIIARTEDMGTAWAKHFYVREANSNPTSFESKGNGFKIELPKEHLRYTATPEWDVSEGAYEADGINSKNVAMSSTESGTTKESILKLDPHVEDGFAEDSSVTVVLPYVSTAKEGVERTGKIVEDQGSAETNGILFSDKDNVWYMELLSGHHWVAVRVPDDSYAVVPNMLAIQKIDWDDKENVMYSKDLPKFIKDNKLADDVKKASLREIFADQDKDNKYNLPRLWDAQRTLTPSNKREITDEKYDFFQKADKPVSVAKVGQVLSLHFNGTKYDTKTGSEPDKYRPISVPQTMEAHILQFRKDVPEEISGIHWLAMGVTDTSSFVPFYNGMTETPKQYQMGTDQPDNESAYWTYRMNDVYANSDYKNLKNKEILPTRQKVRKHLNQELEKTDKEAESLIKSDAKALPELLNKKAVEFSDYALKENKEMQQRMIIELTKKTPTKHNKKL